MKRWLLHIFCVSMFSMLTASCSQIIDDPTDGSCEDKTKIVFTLSLANATNSRAVWNPGTYNPSDLGTEFDNLIAPNSLQVILYNADNDYIGKVNNLSYYPTDIINVYRFVGEISTSILENNQLDCKIMVFANFEETIGPNTDLSSLKFDFDSDHIPMWGVQTFDVTLQPGKFKELEEPIYLLRAMAKIEVKLSTDVSNLSLAKVYLSDFNKEGYSLPNGYGSYGDTREMNVDLVINSIKDDDVEILEFSENRDGFIVYLPEYTVTLDDNPIIYLDITQTNDDGTTTELEGLPLYLRNYDNKHKPTGDYFNIVRNHYYEYIITGVNDGYNLLLTCEVQPWDVEEIAIDYTDIATYTPLGWQEDTYDEQYSNEQNIYLTKGTTAIYKFKLESPQTAQIYASLTNSEDFEIGTQIVDSEIKDTTTGTTSIIKEVTISISAKDETDGIIGRYNETSLRVFAIMDNQESVELDMTGNSKTSTQQGVQVARYKIIQNY